ncbi:guanine nucleotide exchange factor C9orf72-like isoform X2 [Hetaerina americana]
MSRWDDIVGPKTVRVWFQEQSHEDMGLPIVFSRDGSDKESNDMGVKSKVPLSSEACNTEIVYSNKQEYHPGESGNIASQSELVDSNLFSAIKYVTNHTVNCLAVARESDAASSSCLQEKGTSFFAVPDVNLVFLSLMFLVKEGNTHVPYSFALITSYENYEYFLQLRSLCLQWLRRIAFRFHTLLVKNSCTFDTSLWKNLNEWIMDFCKMLVEVKQSSLDTMSFQISGNVVKSKIIKRALTSHLQTFGSSVVIGETADSINNMIAFLGLFLDDTDKHSSCLIDPLRKYSYHMGLKLQGLLLDEYGGRDLASLELMSNPIPVTVIDLTVGDSFGAVKQTSNFHSYLVNQQEMYRNEYRFLNQGNGSSLDHESVMQNVRETGRLVNDAIRDLEFLPVVYWETYIKTFRRRLNCLALSLLSLVSWMRNTGNQGGLIKFPGESRGGITLAKYLKNTLRLDDADFLVVLSAAEKLKPGIYIYVLERNNP